jgi:peptidoglycan hydrolase-like protein with peptidoglycan-binding domain
MPSSDQQQMTPSQQQSTGSQQSGNQQAQNTIDPQQLSSLQIKQIQQSLDKQGFKAGHADGKWGSETAQAVKQFQQKQNMQASGQLDQQTLQALGVNVTAQGSSAHSQGASTTGQGSNEELPSPSQSFSPNATGSSGQNGSPKNQTNQR